METFINPNNKEAQQKKQIGPVAFGAWSGGRFMHFGKTLTEEEYHDCVRLAYEQGIRTFITADVYGCGQADTLLGNALSVFPRESYSLIGAIGHDFYYGKREGNGGFPRFSEPSLRTPDQYRNFLKTACSRSLERCQSDYFDLLLLHNPNEEGYTNPRIWEGLHELKEEGLVKSIGIAPGPANGFVPDLVQNFENFGHLIDWAMIILNPLESWPMHHILDAADRFGINIMTRVLDHGGVFYDELLPDHEFKPGDHRSYRPDGWVERGYNFVEEIRPMTEAHGLTPLQYAANWNLSFPSVKCVIPTFIQEHGEKGRNIKSKIKEIANLPIVSLSEGEVEMVRQIGDNTGCMLLKGASSRHTSSERCDEWPMRNDLLDICKAYDLGTDW